MLSALRATPTATRATSAVAQILANDRRLAVIRLLANDAPRSLSDLTQHIARAEVGGVPDSAERKAVYVGLYQTHLPTLADADVVGFETVGREVRRGPEFDAYNAARDALAEHTEGQA